MLIKAISFPAAALTISLSVSGIFPSICHADDAYTLCPSFGDVHYSESDGGYGARPANIIWALTAPYQGDAQTLNEVFITNTTGDGTDASTKMVVHCRYKLRPDGVNPAATITLTILNDLYWATTLQGSNPNYNWKPQATTPPSLSCPFPYSSTYSPNLVPENCPFHLTLQVPTQGAVPSPVNPNQTAVMSSAPVAPAVTMQPDKGIPAQTSAPAAVSTSPPLAPTPGNNPFVKPNPITLKPICNTGFFCNQ